MASARPERSSAKVPIETLKYWRSTLASLSDELSKASLENPALERAFLDARKVEKELDSVLDGRSKV